MLMRGSARTKIAGRATMTTLEGLLFAVTVAGIVGLIVKVYEVRQDVLYGPYLRRDDELRIP